MEETDRKQHVSHNLTDRSSQSSQERSNNTTNATVLEAPRSLDAGNLRNESSEPPDGGYGWLVTVCVALINAHTWGINSVR